MLRIVHPAPKGQGSDPSARRSRARRTVLSLNPDEHRRLRIAIRNTARAYGGLPVLASVTGLSEVSLHKVAYSKRGGSVAFARVIAKAGGVSIESILSGALNDTGKCKACGARIGAGKAGAS